MIQVSIYAEEWIMLSQDPVVQMVSKDLEGVPVNITVHRREMPCTLAVISDHGEAEGQDPQRTS